MFSLVFNVGPDLRFSQLQMHITIAFDGLWKSGHLACTHHATAIRRSSAVRREGINVSTILVRRANRRKYSNMELNV